MTPVLSILSWHSWSLTLDLSVLLSEPQTDTERGEEEVREIESERNTKRLSQRQVEVEACRFMICFIIEIRRLRFSILVDFCLDGFRMFVFWFWLPLFGSEIFVAKLTLP